MSKKVKRNIFCVGSMLSSLYFQTTILAQNTYGFSQKVVLISIHTNTSAFYFHGFLIYFFLYFLLLSLSSLHHIPPPPTMTSADALHTLQSTPSMIIFQLLSPSIFSYFILFSVPLSRFYFQCQ